MVLRRCSHRAQLQQTIPCDGLSPERQLRQMWPRWGCIPWDSPHFWGAGTCRALRGLSGAAARDVPPGGMLSRTCDGDAELGALKVSWQLRQPQGCLWALNSIWGLAYTSEVGFTEGLGLKSCLNSSQFLEDQTKKWCLFQVWGGGKERLWERKEEKTGGHSQFWLIFSLFLGSILLNRLPINFPLILLKSSVCFRRALEGAKSL